MKIDPGGKIFVTVFTIVLVGVIGFFIASIFISGSDDLDVKTIYFSRSKFHFSIKKLKSDKQYVVEVYNGRLAI